MSTEPTPTPWRAVAGGVIGATRTVCVSPDDTNPDEWPTNRANEALIVRTVNAHDALLAACEAMAAWSLSTALARHNRDLSAVAREWLALKKTGLAAIAKARGQS